MTEWLAKCGLFQRLDLADQFSELKKCDRIQLHLIVDIMGVSLDSSTTMTLSLAGTEVQEVC